MSCKLKTVGLFLQIITHFLLSRLFVTVNENATELKNVFTKVTITNEVKVFFEFPIQQVHF